MTTKPHHDPQSIALDARNVLAVARAATLVCLPDVVFRADETKLARHAPRLPRHEVVPRKAPEAAGGGGEVASRPIPTRVFEENAPC